LGYSHSKFSTCPFLHINLTLPHTCGIPAKFPLFLSLSSYQKSINLNAFEQPILDEQIRQLEEEINSVEIELNKTSN
jgi:hypothetical protein